MSRFFIRLAYDGSGYHGWQVQQNAHTVQAEIEDKLSTLLGSTTQLVGCGRTDTGVHAREFFAHFDVERMPFSEKELSRKLNSFLPGDIAIERIFQVDDEMHARFSAVSRTYKYFIARKKLPFFRHYSYFLNVELDVESMQQAAGLLPGLKDFTSFSKLHTQTATNLCTVTEARWEQMGDELVFTISADRFLRNMVRAVVGTLLEIGRSKMNPEDITYIIEAKDRSRAGYSVPAHGLFLEKVVYPLAF